MNLRSAWQTWIFVCAAIITIAVNFVLQPDLQMQLLMLVPAVVVLGLPHGALDLSIAQILWPLEGWRGKARFVSLYISLALLVIGIWIVLLYAVRLINLRLSPSERGELVAEF